MSEFQPHVCILCNMPTSIDGVPVGGMVVTIPTGTRDDGNLGGMKVHFDCMMAVNAVMKAEKN